MFFYGDFMKQDKINCTSWLVVTSVMMIFCALWHMLWRILSAFMNITDKVQAFGSESFTYNEISSYAHILGGGSSLAAVHGLLLRIIVPLQMICGALGIINAVLSKKNISAVKIISFLSGLAMCIIGAAAALTALFSGAVPVYICVFLTFTLFTVPLMHEVISVKMLIGEGK